MPTKRRVRREKIYYYSLVDSFIRSGSEDYYIQARRDFVWNVQAQEEITEAITIIRVESQPIATNDFLSDCIDDSYDLSELLLKKNYDNTGWSTTDRVPNNSSEEGIVLSSSNRDEFLNNNLIQRSRINGRYHVESDREYRKAKFHTIYPSHILRTKEMLESGFLTVAEDIKLTNQIDFKLETPLGKALILIGIGGMVASDNWYR